MNSTEENDGEYRKLSKAEITRESKNLRGWSIVKGKLHREVDFASFEDAISFISRAALDVTKMDHHPEWSNVYNHVTIDLVTHDVGGLSNYDFRLARLLNNILATYKR